MLGPLVRPVTQAGRWALQVTLSEAGPGRRQAPSCHTERRPRPQPQRRNPGPPRPPPPLQPQPQPMWPQECHSRARLPRPEDHRAPLRQVCSAPGPGASPSLLHPVPCGEGQRDTQGPPPPPPGMVGPLAGRDSGFLRLPSYSDARVAIMRGGGTWGPRHPCPFSQSLPKATCRATVRAGRVAFPFAHNPFSAREGFREEAQG